MTRVSTARLSTGLQWTNWSVVARELATGRFGLANADDTLQFVACANSTRSRDDDESKLFEAVDTMPAGVGELTRLQNAGHS